MLRRPKHSKFEVVVPKEEEEEEDIYIYIYNFAGTKLYFQQDLQFGVITERFRG
jgi:hypothetical protein